MDPVEMFAAYEQERQGVHTEIDPGKGFITWKTLFTGAQSEPPGPRDVYVVDIYVAPECRKNGVAAALTDIVTEKAKALGGTRLVGTVDVRNFTRTTAMKALLAYGFEFDHVDGFMLVFLKEIR